MIFPTDNGSIAFTDHVERVTCCCCGREGEDLAKVVSVAAEQGNRAEMRWCGTCLSAALAIHLGAHTLRN
jgi:hypothetical protein